MKCTCCDTIVREERRKILPEVGQGSGDCRLNRKSLEKMTLELYITKRVGANSPRKGDDHTLDKTAVTAGR